MSKVLSWEDRQSRELEFVQKYVENGGNATEAAKAVGVSDNSASTVGHRLKNRLSDEIETEQSASLSGYAVKAVSYLKFLAESAKSESVRLGAIKDILDRAGFKPVDRQEIHQINQFENMPTEQLHQELNEIREDWLADYLRENNLELINRATYEKMNAALDHKLGLAGGKQDH